MDGSQVSTFYGEAVQQGITDQSAWGVNAEVLQRLAGSLNVSNPPVDDRPARAVLTEATLIREDGSRVPVKIPPITGEILWEYTEYSPTSKVVSHSVATTFGGKPYVVTKEWNVDENGEPDGQPQDHDRGVRPEQARPRCHHSNTSSHCLFVRFLLACLGVGDLG